MLSNISLEQAEDLASQAREARLAAARADLKKAGASECEDCERTIPKRRRLAYPSATRCIACQSAVERRTFGR